MPRCASVSADRRQCERATTQTCSVEHWKQVVGGLDPLHCDTASLTLYPSAGCPHTHCHAAPKRDHRQAMPSSAVRPPPLTSWLSFTEGMAYMTRPCGTASDKSESAWPWAAGRQLPCQYSHVAQSSHITTCTRRGDGEPTQTNQANQAVFCSHQCSSFSVAAPKAKATPPLPCAFSDPPQHPAQHTPRMAGPCP